MGKHRVSCKLQPLNANRDNTFSSSYIPQRHMPPSPQIISVKDLNAIIIQLIGNNKFESRVFNLGGHEKYSFYDILKLLKQSKKIRCFLIKLPKCLQLPLVSLLEYSPYKIITRDNLKSLKVDNICDVNHAYEFLTDLEDLKTYIREL